MKIRNATLKDFPKGKLVILKEDLIVYKKVQGAIVELIIPKGAKAVRPSDSEYCNKIRSNIALVTAIYPFRNFEYESLECTKLEYKNYMHSFIGQTLMYQIGKVIKPEKRFDDTTWASCRSGIHFFVTKEEAENY